MRDIKAHFDSLHDHFNNPAFIEKDPVSVPHAFSRKQDIEISAFFAAIFAWGQRITIINKARELMALMDNAPYDFILKHEDSDLKPLESFKHRTFQPLDLFYLLRWLRHHYQRFDSLEDAFLLNVKRVGKEELHEQRLNAFHDYVFSLPEAPKRTRKHISAPYRKSRNKRINMYLRWMVRKDARGVDFGIWNRIAPSELYIPLDLHVEKIARRFQLLTRKQADWKSVLELTRQLRSWDPADPVRYDFALFGLSISEKQPN